MPDNKSAHNNQTMLENARSLVELIESDNYDEANQVLDELVRAREYDLFLELGKLTRNLHEALNSFRLDTRLNELAAYDIPDAKERLNHVVAMTEQAANRTLNALDEVDPVCRNLEQRAGELDAEWQRFRRREMDANEFRDLAHQLDGFLGQLRSEVTTVRGHLSEVMMAQDFQDLTGQIIRRVIELVHELEESLVDLVRVGGERMKVGDNQAEPKREKPAETIEANGTGPTVPNVDDETKVVNSQDEVDDLLSSLGF